jgi:peptidoglycan/xylan/chitin deacetylase (PgdA/CDA1 family)
VTVSPRHSDHDRARPDPAHPMVVTRRVLLTLGAAAFTQGACGHTNAHASGPAPRPSVSPPRPSPASSPKPSHTPTPAKPWKPPTVARPVPGHCPVLDGVVPRRGGPQDYVPCHGTDIGLTIDDGPHPTWTPLVLKLLARYRVTATFCLIGHNAAAHPQIVAAIVEAGHEVANHTWTHPLPFTGLTTAQVHDEIHRTSDLLTGLDADLTYFRAPGGEWTPDILTEVKAAGLRPLGWSVDPRDWSRPGVPHIVDTILRKTRPGAIILDHDGGGDRRQTIDALTIALPRLLDAGYRFVTPNHRL